MTHMQRILVLIVLTVIFLWGTFFLTRENSKKRMEQWQVLQMERFIHQLGKTGSCSYEDILELSRTLNLYGISSEISLEEYKREYKETQTKAYYLISWTEIAEQLFSERYCFEEKSVIKASIKVTDRYCSKEYQFYAVAERKGK